MEDTRGVRERERWQGGRGRGRVQWWGVYVGGGGGLLQLQQQKADRAVIAVSLCNGEQK